jgi:hypothetical protein
MHTCSHCSYDPEYQSGQAAGQIRSRCQPQSTYLVTQEYHDIGEKTPLHYSVEKNNYEITNFLLDNGANTTLGDKRGLTALHYAARHGFK